MSLPTLTGIPSQFDIGDTVLFTEQFPDFPVGTWTMTLYLSLNGGTPIGTAATTSGSNFLVTLTSTITTALLPGLYQYAEIVTDGTQKATPKQGIINILPNFAVAQTPSTAQAMVTLLQAVLAEFAATTRLSVNYAGQSFTRASINEYKDQLVFWMAELNAEKAALARARGGKDQQRITTQFMQPFTTGLCGGVAPWNNCQ